MWRSSVVRPFWIRVVKSFTISGVPRSICRRVNWLGIYLTQTQQTNVFIKRQIGCFLPKSEVASTSESIIPEKRTGGFRPSGLALKQELRLDGRIERNVFLSSFVMEYTGAEYIVEDVGPDTWIWTVDLNERFTESGRQKTREAALIAVILTIDRWRAGNRRQIAGVTRREDR
jgi:hypothetical protein